jgi:hypothetical protein
MDAADTMLVTDRLTRAAETLRKVNISRLSVLDRVNISSTIVDITDMIDYIKRNK